MLNRVLLISPDRERLAGFIESLRCECPLVVLELNDPAVGMPGSGFPWAHYDLLVLEYEQDVASEGALEWFHWAMRECALPPVVVLSEQASVEIAVRFMKLGAVDYIDLTNVSPRRVAECVADVVLRREGRGGSSSYSSAIREGPAGRNAHADTRTGSGSSSGLSISEVRQLARADNAIAPRAATSDPAATLPDPNALAAMLDSSEETQVLGVAYSVEAQLEIPGYKIEHPLGVGGMASVLLARRLDDDLLIALKVIPLGETEQQAELLRAFMREYSALARLVHTNVVHIHERAFSNQYAYIAMEYLAGGDLKSKIKRGVSLVQAKKYTAQIARGLSAAHGTGLLHGDLKPTNILFRIDDSLALIDFGVAKELSTGGGNAAAEMVAGTPHYLSPEHILGHPLDVRSDLYSLGIVLYEMLVGQVPYISTEYQDVLRSHLLSPVPELPTNAKRFQPLLKGLLAKDPDDRFQSADEVIEALDWL